MSVFLSTRNSRLLHSFSKCLSTKPTILTHTTSTRQYSKQITNPSTFQDVLHFRRNEANRSILVQVQSAQSYKELHAYCSTIGTVSNMFHYSTGVEPMHFIIVEFGNEEDVPNVFANSSYLEDMHAVPVQSQFMWFKATAKRFKDKAEPTIGKLNIENGNKIVKDFELQEALKNSETVCEQMRVLHNATKLNEVGSRLRFLVARQVEMAMSGMFPNACALPFGSSVNGYGKMGCDLDLVLRLNKSGGVKDDTRLVYHSKATMGTERSTSQRHMEAVGDILQLFLPGCSQVRRILQARVPIIKYYQQLTDIECDLSMSNLSGVHMSDLLHLMGSIDERVRPLVFTIRRWAASTGLTNTSPGRWISNFSLTLLVLSFLQSHKILPSINTLVKMADKNDVCITEDGLNCTFLRDPSIYLKAHPTANTDDMNTLLLKFFEFYSSFDFTNKAISLNEGTAITKPDHSALYIVNPLERALNVSKNVSIEELDKFRGELRNAAWALESDEKGVTWGILNLFIGKKAPAVTGTLYNYKPTKLIEVSKLFEDDKDVQFKNEAVRQQVHNIKKEGKEHVKNISARELHKARDKSRS